MKSDLKYLTVIALVLSSALFAGAEEPGEESESTKTFDLNFDSASGSRNANTSVSYTVPLTDNLEFATSTSLTNGHNSEDDRTSRNRGTGVGITYDPPSPWRLAVGYNNSYQLVHRPLSINYDEFKTESSSNTLSSSLDYRFSDDLKADLTLSIVESSQEVIIIETEVPPPTSSLTHTFGGGVDYNVSSSTNVNVDYSGSISDQEIDLNRTETWPPRPDKPADSRDIKNTISTTFSSDKDVTDNITFHIGGNASDSISRDRLQPSLDNDSLDGSASAEINYRPASILGLNNNTSVNRGFQEYKNKNLYEKEFSENLYDVKQTGFSNITTATLNPSDRSEIKVAFTYEESENILSDTEGNRPPRDDTDAASACTQSEGTTLSSNVRVALGQKITFQLYHYLKESRPHSIVFPENDQTTGLNNLDSNIDFKWTDDLEVTVDTSMGITKYRYASDSVAVNSDRNSLNISLSTHFIYDVTRETQLTLDTAISKRSLDYVNPLSYNSSTANINRSFSTKLSRDFGDILKPEISFDISYGKDYYPSNPRSNLRRLGYSISPRTDIYTSPQLRFSLNTSFTEEVTEPSNDPESRPEEWILRRGFSAGAGIAYSISGSLTLSANANNSHNYNIRDRIRRSKEDPGESYFDFDAALNYTF